MIPEWLTASRPARGMCESCHCAPGVTFLHSLTGLLVCVACAASMREPCEVRTA